MTEGQCSYDPDCPEPLWRKVGMCHRHYNRQQYLKKAGKTEEEANSWRQGQTVKERLQSNVIINDEGCWIWQQSTRNHGYGEMWSNEYTDRNTHHLAYIEWNGPIPEGMVIDHECHNEAARQGMCDATAEWCRHRACINPEHLVARTFGDNLLASPLTQSSINKSKTECKRGHPFDEENTRVRENGNRSCKTCDRMTPAERKAWDDDHEVTRIVSPEVIHCDQDF